jgi:hypothetical protein
MVVETKVKGLWVLDPSTEPDPVEASMAPRLDTLDGKVVGTLDNTKPNADRLLDMVAGILSEKYQIAGVVKRRKPGPSGGAPPDILDELARECDFVIAGIGD